MLRKFSSWTKTSSLWTTELKNVNLEKIFTEKRVQDLLKNLTGLDAERIYQKVYTDKRDLRPKKPYYMLCTETAVKNLEEDLREKCEARLHFPPFKYTEEQKVEILSDDKELAGFDNANIVFTDISPSIHRKDRLVTVRQTDGLLRNATTTEYMRMMKTWFPVGYKPKISLPALFDEPYFTQALEGKRYKTALDWACLMLEPMESRYVQIAKTIYDDCNDSKSWDFLWSTRHFGPMIFYLVINKKHENLLEYYVKDERLEEGADLVHLYYICHPEYSELAENLNKDNPLTVLQHYAEQIAANKSLAKELERFSFAEQQKQLLH